jgi:hypothetical protein
VNDHQRIVAVDDADHLERVSVLVGSEEQHLAVGARVHKRRMTKRYRVADAFLAQAMPER